MKAFFAPMKELGEFEEIRRALPKNRGVLQVTGCIDSQKAHFMAALTQDGTDRLIIAANDLRAKEIYENFKLFDRGAYLLPARDFIFFQADVHSNLLERERIKVWKALTDHSGPVTVITTITALMNHLMPIKYWQDKILTARVGDEIDVGEWKRYLVETGYERNAQVEGPGQFAIRGNIIDIYPLTEDNPVRIDLWGDEIDSIRTFDAESQRSVEMLQETVIYPASELVLDADRVRRGLEQIQKQAKKSAQVFRKAMKTEEAARTERIAKDCQDRIEIFEDPSGLDGFLDFFYEEPASLLDAFGPQTRIFLDEPNRLMEAAEAAESEFRESM